MPAPVVDRPRPTHGHPLLRLLATVLAGAVLGTLGDLIPGGQPVSFTLSNIATAWLLSPLAIWIGPAGVSVHALVPVLDVGGFLFWPVEVALILLSIKSPRRWLLFFVFVWTFQGYFQIVHRMAVLTV